MLFNSYIFIFAFLPITFFIYFYLNKKRLTEASKGFLVFSSLFFYSWWNIIYLPIILSSILFNYLIGSILSKSSEGEKKFRKRSVLLFGIILNILLLAYFKYSDFFIENINFIANAQIDLLKLTLPLAISFFTFQQIAYLVDSYRGETKEYDFLNYSLFVTFFPQLIAGPIVHHKEMMSQFTTKKNKIINYTNISLGLFIFSIGLFKKVVIADTFAVWATAGFDTAETLNLIEAWATSLSYTFQLYFDFSGYADMAIGAALLFNIKLPINFNSPYKALNIQDFWKRWHITLSRFLRDYIYIPLGGNRKGSMRTYNNLLATFIIGGIWHGAGWTFIFWGLLHGLALVMHRAWQFLGYKMNSVLAWFITFNFINIAWVFFRARNWDDAIKVLSSMFDLSNIVLTEKLTNKLVFLSEYGIIFSNVTEHIGDGSKVLNWIIGGFILILIFKNSNQKVVSSTLTNVNSLTVIHAVYFAILFMFSILYMSMSTYTEFIYFNF
ncbi:MAG TPA: MBOAT family protein [Flavobacteriaceae bacterium]|nr:MBOAT family protein [Flavobacteriaceae bacterium]